MTTAEILWALVIGVAIVLNLWLIYTILRRRVWPW